MRCHGNAELTCGSGFQDVAVERESEGDMILSDMGCGLPFRAGSFNGAISISAVQWLCNVDKKSHNPIKRLNKFFTQLYSALVSFWNKEIFIYLLSHFKFVQILEPRSPSSLSALSRDT